MGLLLKSHVATTHPSNITRLQVTKTHLQSVLERLNSIQLGPGEVCGEHVEFLYNGVWYENKLDLGLLQCKSGSHYWKDWKKHQEKICNAKQRKKYCIDFKPHCKKYDYYSMKNVCKDKWLRAARCHGRVDWSRWHCSLTERQAWRIVAQIKLTGCLWNWNLGKLQNSLK